jgi:hypothetical protein
LHELGIEGLFFVASLEQTPSQVMRDNAHLIKGLGQTLSVSFGCLGSERIIGPFLAMDVAT